MCRLCCVIVRSSKHIKCLKLIVIIFTTSYIFFSYMNYITENRMKLSLYCSFRALSRINSQGNQQNILRCFIKVYIILHHTKFLYVSVYNMMIIKQHKLNNISSDIMVFDAL